MNSFSIGIFPNKMNNIKAFIYKDMKRNATFKVLLMFIVGLFLSVNTFAQQIVVKGIVKDTTGEPIIGANVIVKGTTNGTITDFDGNFLLNANKGDIIIISFIGYRSQEAQAAASMNIILKDDTELLDEVVVIGYGSVKKDDLSGSVVAIKAEEMNKGAVTSPQELIMGKVPGLSVSQGDGAPGARFDNSYPWRCITKMPAMIHLLLSMEFLFQMMPLQALPMHLPPLIPMILKLSLF